MQLESINQKPNYQHKHHWSPRTRDILFVDGFTTTATNLSFAIILSSSALDTLFLFEATKVQSIFAVLRFSTITMDSFLRFCVLVVSLLLAATSAAFVPAGSRSTAFSSRQSTVSATSVAMGVAVLERDAVLASGPAFLERTAEQRTKEPTRERKLQGNENWEVRIYNDGLNTREHVARSLVQVTGMSELIAYQTMMQAHQNGIAVVGRWVFEVAEMYHDELKRNGIVCDIIPVDGDSR